MSALPKPQLLEWITSTLTYLKIQPQSRDHVVANKKKVELRTSLTHSFFKHGRKERRVKGNYTLQGN